MSEESYYILFPYTYQKRNNPDLIKVYLLNNSKTCRGFFRVCLYTALSFIMWMFFQNLFTLLLFLLFLGLLIMGIIGFTIEWLQLKSFERREIPYRTIVCKRSLEFGQFGMRYEELSSQGLSKQEYAWNRYRGVLEWNSMLILLPAKEKAVDFVVWRDEIGEEGFAELKAFLKKELSYREITNIWEIIM